MIITACHYLVFKHKEIKVGGKKHPHTFLDDNEPGAFILDFEKDKDKFKIESPLLHFQRAISVIFGSLDWLRTE